MIFAILGGDDRSVRLARLLRGDGHTVRPFALEQALPDAYPDPAEALRGAEAVLLPLPAQRGGKLNAPFSAGIHAAPELLRHAAPGTPVICGVPDAALRERCRERGLPLFDLMERESFVARNAALTAEGTLALLAQGPGAILGRRILVAGCGRVGRALARRLAALEAEVTVAARSQVARDWATSQGCRAVPLESAAAPGYDAAVNTVPARVFDHAALRRFGQIPLIELASAPYGFDPAAAQALGNPVRLAAGVPGTYAPEASAAAMREALDSILKERDTA